MLLFLRPSNGVYLPPKFIRLDGKSTIYDIGVTKKDMPNFFVEAVTVADGRVYYETKEIVVPPEKRILNVEIKPSAETYKPGEKAKVKIKLTDFTGEAFSGSTVVAIYDKSLEYISGGSNVPDIKEFFWKWRRSHYPQTENSLARWFNTLVPPNTKGMGDLGVFGGTVAEEMEELSDISGREAVQMPSAGMGGFGVMREYASRSGFCGQRRYGRDRCHARHASHGRGTSCDRHGWQRCGGKIAHPGRRRTPLVQPTVRTKFADTALWVGALTTEKDGTAEVSLDMPENLTTWRIKVWGMGHGTKVGQGQTDVVTRKDLIIRMEAPRFFVQTDEVVLSAIVHNYLKTKKQVKVALELEGKCLEPMETIFKAGRVDAAGNATIEPIIMPPRTTQTIFVQPNGEARVDWRVKVLDEGEAVVRMKALTDEESDAMEQKFPCYIHGMLKMDSYSGVICARRTKAASSPSTCRSSGGPSSRGSRCAIRPRWPGRWSMPCRTWSIIPTAAPSRRSTASCPP